MSNTTRISTVILQLSYYYTQLEYGFITLTQKTVKQTSFLSHLIISSISFSLSHTHTHVTTI